MANFNPNYNTCAVFVAKLHSGDETAKQQLRVLRARADAGDRRAALALYKIAAGYRSPAMISAGYTAIGAFHVPAVLANLGHLGGKVFGMTGRALEKVGTVGAHVLQKTGEVGAHVLQKGTAVAAKPFHYAEQKMGGNKSIALLPAHTHIP